MPPKKAVGGGQSEGWACPPWRSSFCPGKVTRGGCPLAILPTSVGWHFLAGSSSPAVYVAGPEGEKERQLSVQQPFLLEGQEGSP